jgi:hypothetical protein
MPIPREVHEIIGISRGSYKQVAISIGMGLSAALLIRKLKFCFDHSLDKQQEEWLMNRGQTVFSQIMDFIPMYEFRKCV